MHDCNMFHSNASIIVALVMYMNQRIIEQINISMMHCGLMCNAYVSRRTSQRNAFR